MSSNRSTTTTTNQESGKSSTPGLSRRMLFDKVCPHDRTRQPSCYCRKTSHLAGRSQYVELVSLSQRKTQSAEHKDRHHCIQLPHSDVTLLVPDPRAELHVLCATVLHLPDQTTRGECQEDTAAAVSKAASRQLTTSDTTLLHV